MGDKTKIQWADATWNAIRGCSRVSAGCMNCYAEKVAARFAYDQPIDHNKPPGPYFGLVNDRGGWNGRVDLIEDHLLDPLRWRNPRKIFVNSMSDLFHENVPDEWIDRIFAVMALAPQHTFQVLTKRPERMRKYLAHTSALICLSVNRPFPLPNVWLGVSVEDQKSADERIPLLLQTPAAIRFVSYEPAIGPVDFGEFFCPHWPAFQEVCWKGGARNCADSCNCDCHRSRPDWIIVGGESGPGARRFDPAWARSVVQQCKAAGVACFIKQMGSNAKVDWEDREDLPAPAWTKFLNRKGDDPEQWPEELRLREFPTVRAVEK